MEVEAEQSKAFKEVKAMFATDMQLYYLQKDRKIHNVH